MRARRKGGWCRAADFDRRLPRFAARADFVLGPYGHRRQRAAPARPATARAYRADALLGSTRVSDGNACDRDDSGACGDCAGARLGVDGLRGAARIGPLSGIAAFSARRAKRPGARVVTAADAYCGGGRARRRKGDRAQPGRAKDECGQVAQEGLTRVIESRLHVRFKARASSNFDESERFPLTTSHPHGARIVGGWFR